MLSKCLKEEVDSSDDSFILDEEEKEEDEKVEDLAKKIIRGKSP